jgi:hypothetical protein
MALKEGDADSLNRGGEVGMFNVPDISDTGKVKNKPLSNARQAHSVYMRFERDNIARSLRNKVISDKYNLMPPYNQHELDASGQGWRANFHTGFIGSINDRITPRLTDTVHSMRYLTMSKIPLAWEDSDSKTIIFRQHITNTIRAWIGWNDFIDQLASEVGYFGYSAAIQTGQYDWRPKTFRQDEMYFDEHSRQHAAELPVFAVRKSYFVHQLVDMISDDETTEEIGYRVQNIAAAIRAATAPVLRPNVDLRLLSDIVREGTLYYSYHRSVRMIETVHMFASDYDAQGIDHWWFNRKMDAPGRSASRIDDGDSEEDDNDPILFLHETYDGMAMEDFITLFTFQAGNNRLFGSKGIGRMLANLDTAINRVRMSTIDSIFISQMLVGKVDEATMARIQPTVRFPFMWLPEGPEILAQQFQIQVDSFLQLDNQLKQMAEVIAGAYLPDQTQLQNQMPETATAEAIDAQREEEVKAGTLNRWWRQVTEMIQCMQKRLCNTTNLNLAVDIFKKQQAAQIAGKPMVPSQVYELMMAVDGDLQELYEPMPKLGRGDPDAVDMLLKMMEQGLTPAEILVASHTRSTEPAQINNAEETAKYAQWFQGMKMIQSANWDWPKAEEILAVDQIGAARTKELYIGDQGQQTQTEQARQQMLETGAMMGGDQVPVSPRDDHMAHLGVALPKIGTQLQAMKATPPATIGPDELPSIGRQIDHAKAHAAGLEVQGNKVPPKAMQQIQAQIKDFVTQMSLIGDARIKDIALAQALQQRQQAVQMNEPFEPDATKTTPNGAPVITPAITDELAKDRNHAVDKMQKHGQKR